MQNLLLATAAAILISGVAAFSPTTMKARLHSVLFQTPHYPHQQFHRAVDCAQDPSLCNVDEMLQLADELEKYDQCFFESEMDPVACEKEKMDRMDVADLLRLEAEVVLRGDYLYNANLFAEDVEQARLKKTWDGHSEAMDAYSNY